MKLHIEKKGSYKLVKLQEERLDIISASKLKVEMFILLQNHWNKNIVLDISSCSFCDASGLNAIQAIHNLCEEYGGVLIVTGIQTYIDQLIKICMLNTVWNIAIDINEVDTLMKSKVENEFMGLALQEA